MNYMYKVSGLGSATPEEKYYLKLRNRYVLRQYMRKTMAYHVTPVWEDGTRLGWGCVHVELAVGVYLHWRRRNCRHLLQRLL